MAENTRILSYKQLDIATLMGLTAAIALVVAAIALGGEAQAFWNIPSIGIVIGGTLALTLASYTTQEFRQLPGLVRRTIYYRHFQVQNIVHDLLEIAETARREGFLKLQATATDSQHSSFFRHHLQMVIDSLPPERIFHSLQHDITELQTKHALGSSILRRAADIAPAMGLIGTLVGLVQMLGNLEDPSKIGPAMAVALLTTLYGAMLAYMLFTPLASKLEHTSAQEQQVLRLYQETLLSMLRHENPRQLEVTLNAILQPSQRVHYYNDFPS